MRGEIYMDNTSIIEDNPDILSKTNKVIELLKNITNSLSPREDFSSFRESVPKAESK